MPETDIAAAIGVDAKTLRKHASERPSTRI
jgi:hypothetical protein